MPLLWPGARSQSDEIKGLLAANETSGSSSTLSAAALLTQLQEMTNKLDTTLKENARLTTENERVVHENKNLVQEVSDASPLKALIVGCWEFKESKNFCAIAQVKASCVMLRQALVASG